jgi:hypothetical protein
MGLDNKIKIWFSLFFFPLIAHAQTSAQLVSAIEIVKKGLSQNVVSVTSYNPAAESKRYLLAGAHQYHSLWAWDFSFASLGALKIGEAGAVHDSLEIYFSNQRADGVLPRVIDNREITWRVILGMAGITPHFGNPLKASFETENRVLSPIPNAILPWAASRYILFTQDRVFAKKWFSAAEKAVEWLEFSSMDDGLIGKQAPYSDWEDSVQRTGKVAFTNELYALSLQGLAQWAEFLGDHDKEIFYLNRFQTFKKTFRDFFWMKDRNAIRNFEGDDRLAADANLLAVAYHLVDDPDAKAILNTLRSSPLWQPMPGKVTWPDYPRSMKSALPKIVGLAGYHDKMLWLWLTALAVKAERAVGNGDAAKHILDQASRLIISEGALYEIYEQKRNGSLKPVRRILYHPEHPFTWSSGLFLEAALEN